MQHITVCCNALHMNNITRCAIGIHLSEFGVNIHTDFQAIINDTSDESVMIQSRVNNCHKLLI